MQNHRIISHNAKAPKPTKGRFNIRPIVGNTGCDSRNAIDRIPAAAPKTLAIPTPTAA
jgi:hypothetical protein